MTEGIAELSESQPDKGFEADKLPIAKSVITTAKNSNNTAPIQAPCDADRELDAAKVLEKISGPTI